jgi:hypothetical protein
MITSRYSSKRLGGRVYADVKRQVVDDDFADRN